MTLNTSKRIYNFISYKLNTQSTNYNIPSAILLKFKYHDPAFFISFTNNKQIKPAHQIEFDELLRNATNKYKLQHKAMLIDRQTRNQIQLKLQQKLIIEYLTNLNFRNLKSGQASQVIKYCRNFIKATPVQDNQQIQDAIHQAYEEKK